MNLTSFRGVTFTTLGVTSPKFAAPESPSADRQPNVIARTGSDPIIPGVDQGARVMTFWFTPAVGQTVEPTFAKILALCNPDDTTDGTLVGTFLKTGPSTFATVQAQAQVGTWSYPDVNTLAIDFILSSPWREASATTLLANTTYNADSSFANLNTGFRDALPTITIGAFPSRSSKNASYGFNRKVEFTLTNNGTEPIINYPYQIGPFDSTLNWVTAGFALANGNDVRLFAEGVEWPRNLINWNSEQSFIWTVIPLLSPGQSIIVSVVTGNASAGSPPTLTLTSTPLLPAVDISGTGSTGSTSSTTTTLTVTGAGWETDQWQGGTIVLGNSQIRRIASNTATVLTITRAWVAPGTTVDWTVIKSGMMGDGGTASAATSTSITDSSQVWRTNEWIGATVKITGGTGSNSVGTVVSNTATALTVTSWSGTAPAAASTFNVYRYNGIWMWDTRPVPKTTNHPGLWLTNKTQAPPTIVSFDAPGSWYRFAYQRSDDEYSQPRYASFTVGAGDLDHMPTMYIQRARKGKVGDQREVGLADAIGVGQAFPINGIFFGYTIRNAKKANSGSPGSGMAEARFMTQESGGNNWSTFLSDTNVNNTSTAVTPAWYDLTGYGTPSRIAMTLIPNASDEIPDNDNNTALLQSSGNYVSLSVDSRNIASTVDWLNSPPSLTVCADLYLIIRNGGAAATKPYERIVIGAPGHRVFLKGNGTVYDEQIKIDCEAHIVSLVDNSGVFIRRIPYAVQIQDVVADSDGTQRTLTGNRWLPIPSSSIDSANIYFTDPSGAGWLAGIRISATGKLGYLT